MKHIFKHLISYGYKITDFQIAHHVFAKNKNGEEIKIIRNRKSGGYNIEKIGVWSREYGLSSKTISNIYARDYLSAMDCIW